MAVREQLSLLDGATSPFRAQDAQYSHSVVVPLQRPTDHSAAISQAGLAGLHAIFQRGFRYAKAGVMLLNITPASQKQHELDLEDDRQTGSRGRLMQALDGVNLRYGRGALLLASAGTEGNHRAWTMKQDRRTPGYTTLWSELAVARA